MIREGSQHSFGKIDFLDERFRMSQYAPRKPNWEVLAPILGPTGEIMSPTLPLAPASDDLIYSDFSEVTDIARLQAVISNLQQSCEILQTGYRRAVEQHNKAVRENFKFVERVEKLQSTTATQEVTVHRCETCRKKYKTQFSLARHIYHRHPEDSPTASPTNNRQSEQARASLVAKTPALVAQIPADFTEACAARVVAAMETQQREGREWLAAELQSAVRRALELQALLPPGQSWAGDLDISGGSFLTPSP
jgi:hypothetical protein